MKNPIIIGAPSYDWALPLTQYLNEFPVVTVRRETRVSLLSLLQSGELDCALLSVGDVLNLSNVRVMPGIGVSMLPPAAWFMMYAAHHDRAPRRMAYRQENAEEALLAQLVVARCLGSPPVLEPLVCPQTVGSDVDGILTMYPDPTFSERFPIGVNLVEMWQENTGLPLVRALWIVHPHVSLSEIRRVLALALLRYNEVYDGEDGTIAPGVRYRLGTNEMESIALLANLAAQFNLGSKNQEIVFC